MAECRGRAVGPWRATSGVPNRSCRWRRSWALACEHAMASAVMVPREEVLPVAQADGVLPAQASSRLNRWLPGLQKEPRWPVGQGGCGANQRRLVAAGRVTDQRGDRETRIASDQVELRW